MKKLILMCGVLLLAVACCQAPKEEVAKLPWENGKLIVSENGRYLQHENGAPFFWLGETGWLLPEKLDRENAIYYLDACQKAGFNVVQVQTINGVPARNVFGKLSHPNGFDFSQIEAEGEEGYWQHMDYIIKQAEERGIYIGMVCIWGGLVICGFKKDYAPLFEDEVEAVCELLDE